MAVIPEIFTTQEIQEAVEALKRGEILVNNGIWSTNKVMDDMPPQLLLCCVELIKSGDDERIK